MQSFQSAHVADGLTRDEGALDASTFANAYAPRVYRFACFVARNDADAADLAQEALIKAVRKLGTYHPERSDLDAWLWRIVVNTARDAGRASRRHRRLWERVLSDSRTTAPASPEDVAIANLADAELLAAVRRLPKRDRTVIALRFGGQLNTAEVAQELGTTPAAVVMATRRALQRLRRYLEVHA